MDDIPRRVRDRPSFAALSPEDEQEFLRKQAGLEAAHRTTRDPQVLGHALLQVYSLRQTLPKWVVWDLLNAVIEQRTDEVAERDRERVRHVQRYIVIRDLLRSGHTVVSALNQAECSSRSNVRQHPAAPLRTATTGCGGTWTCTDARASSSISLNWHPKLPRWRRVPTRPFGPLTARFQRLILLGILRPPLHPRPGSRALRKADLGDLPPRPLP